MVDMKKVMVISLGRWVKYALAGVLALSLIIGVSGLFDTENAVPVSTMTGDIPVSEDGQSALLTWLESDLSDEQLKQTLGQGWSLLDQQNPTEGSIWSNLLDRSLTRMLGFDLASPYGQLAEGMAILSLGQHQGVPLSQAVAVEFVEEETDYYLDTSAQIDNWHFEMNKLTQATLTNQVMILLYHTHNAETYLPSAGVSKLPGQNAGVSTAADVFKETLESKYGLKTLHCKVLHDYPDWNRSYINSLFSAQSLLVDNKDVQAVFDVHRDAGFTSKEPTTVEIGGKKAAKIMIVVGANHDNWKSNLAFAQKLEDKCSNLYPGLMRNMRIVEANRYNQQAHPQSLILEVGSDLNTQEEANYALECFAQVVAEVLLEE